jgi:hypothetical protein
MRAFAKIVLATLSLFAASVKMALAGAAITSTASASGAVCKTPQGQP